MEIKTSLKISQNRSEDKNQSNKRWVSVESILNDLEQAIEKGNVEGGGFSAALWISKLKKKLEEK